MQNNKLVKSLIAFSSLCFVVVIVLIFKIQGDSAKLDNLKKSLNSEDYDVLKKNQEVLVSERESILNEAAKAPRSDVTEQETTQTVIPGKVIEKKVTVPADNTTKSS